MFGFGDEFVIESYRIPWLIWIQILVMFLLTITIILYYFSLDDDPTNANLLSFSSTSHLEPPSTCFQTAQVAANHDVQEEISTRRVESNSESNGASVKDLAPSQSSHLKFHPCRYFDLAKQAFLKCFGLGSVLKKSPTCDKEHED